MPITCPTGKKPRYRFRKTKKGKQRLAFCNNKVVETKTFPKDTDKDGVPDYRDCEPNNPKKHGVATTFAIGAGASYVGSEVSRYVSKKRRLAKLKKTQEEKKYWK